MEALEFLKERKRMCRSFGTSIPYTVYVTKIILLIFFSLIIAYIPISTSSKVSIFV